MKGKFRLTGLSKPNRATLQHLHTDKDIFWADINMPQDRIDALWLLCKGDWGDLKIAEVTYDKLSADGIPINAVLTGIKFTNN